MDRSKRRYWEVRGTQVTGPPLPQPARPSDEDISGFEACAAALAQSLGRPPEVLVLGFTRGIVSMRWPARSELVAMDWSGAMMRRIWPAGSLPRNVAPVIGDWREMPLRAACVDLVIGDGCYASQNSFADCATVTEEVWRVLRPAGRFVQRCFSRPDTVEPVDGLFDDLRAGRIAAFEQFRWRLAMALHPAGEAVAAGKVWRTWHERVADPRTLCAMLGWPESDTAAIDAWNEQDVRIPLPALAELHALTEKRFEMLECRIPAYPMGPRFPTLVLRPRP